MPTGRRVSNCRPVHEFPMSCRLLIAEKDLRETFDLPLMSARDAERSGADTEHAIGDAAALLDDRGGPRRRTTAAEARARARRCSQCGGLVPQGMSICVSCGIDQETGLRVGLEDDLAPPPPPPPQGPPIHIALIGGLCGTAGLILLILSLIRSVGGSERLAELRLALPGPGLGLRHLRLRAVHPGPIGKAPDAGIDPGRRHRLDGPGRHAAGSWPTRDTQAVQVIDPGNDPDITDTHIKPLEERIDAPEHHARHCLHGDLRDPVVLLDVAARQEVLPPTWGGEDTW